MAAAGRPALHGPVSLCLALDEGVSGCQGCRRLGVSCMAVGFFLGDLLPWLLGTSKLYSEVPSWGLGPTGASWGLLLSVPVSSVPATVLYLALPPSMALFVHLLVPSRTRHGRMLVDICAQGQMVAGTDGQTDRLQKLQQRVRPGCMDTRPRPCPASSAEPGPGTRLLRPSPGPGSTAGVEANTGGPLGVTVQRGQDEGWPGRRKSGYRSAKLT